MKASQERLESLAQELITMKVAVQTVADAPEVLELHLFS